MATHSFECRALIAQSRGRGRGSLKAIAVIPVDAQGLLETAGMSSIVFAFRHFEGLVELPKLGMLRNLSMLQVLVAY